MKADLKLAGIEYGNEQIGYANLHAQRMSLSTSMAVHQLSPRVRQAHMRHTDPRLTNVTYMDEKPNLIVLINPELVSKSGSCVSEEGCLSLPEIREDVERAEKVVARALGRDGEPVEISADGLLATAIQHEMDHLDGVLLIDHLSFLKRQMISRELKKKKQTRSKGR